MAALNFESATLKLSYETGVDKLGKTVLTSKTYRNVRPDLDASQLASVVQAISGLSSYPLHEAQQNQTQSIEM
ncbi:DUF1659 domain-containing protein [Lysinibacillus telephonicus]|uniref:DUF1659 domain-containing protein n=1 Tax=Lysinibacillus telephonicus TaxID=1714840 RepID=A0A3S0J5S5_9BACI|nr:DUF1659 domain-containing protein [Lysinibacillus telephonicus]RTQ96039.1 DUF1659 domain-containing protein [Lysinibacillus telephonicus]